MKKKTKKGSSLARAIKNLKGGKNQNYTHIIG